MDPLLRALKLASRGRYRASPNPLVGAVLVRDGEIVGEGWHDEVGQSHAEVMALRDAGEAARGATLYLNLEPCDHHGRTPPCTEAVIAAGVSRVVASHHDPDPRVAGRGFARLREAGLDVEVGACLEAAVGLNLAFLTSLLVGRPAVTLKWAMSLDGRIATASGESQWISSPAGRRWALELRETHDAILVGSGTALADDPRLDRRRGKAAGPSTRVVLDRRLRLLPGARMLELEGPVLVFTENRDRSRREALEAQGAEVLVRDEVTPAQVLASLNERGLRSLLVEGGGEVLGAFLLAGLFDRVAVCCAPLLIGGREAKGPLGGEGFARLEEALRVEDLRVSRRGVDLILEGHREGALGELLGSLRAATMG